MYNCIYSDGEVTQRADLDCPDFSSRGGDLVDVIDESTVINVTAPAPDSFGTLFMIGGALLVLSYLFGGGDMYSGNCGGCGNDDCSCGNGSGDGLSGFWSDLFNFGKQAVTSVMQRPTAQLPTYTPPYISPAQIYSREPQSEASWASYAPLLLIGGVLLLFSMSSTGRRRR